MFIYTIADADAHLTDATPSPVQKSLLIEDAQILDFITSIESSDNSKDVIEKYNENLSSGRTPSWLEDDFKPASLSDIEVRVFRLKQTDKLSILSLMNYSARPKWRSSACFLLSVHYYSVWHATRAVTVGSVRCW